jgi:hypothetical protein
MSGISDVLEALDEGADRDLGAVVLALDAREENEQADLLFACTLGYGFDSEWGDGMMAIPVLSADPAVHSLISESTRDFLEEQCRQLHSDGCLQIGPLKIRLAVPTGDWRQRRQESRDRGERPVDNQATYSTAAAVRRRDRLNFGSAQEVSVYKALLRRQGKLPAEATIAILPGPGTRVLGRTFWPDFVVTYQGRSGMIEVDGPHHQGRAAADHSRDALLSDAGVGHVGRITVEDAASDSELDRFVERFLQRLTR